jgi:hypothetical protein
MEVGGGDGANEVGVAMTVKYVARAEGLRPITCDHGTRSRKCR